MFKKQQNVSYSANPVITHNQYRELNNYINNFARYQGEICNENSNRSIEGESVATSSLYCQCPLSGVQHAYTRASYAVE